MTEKQREYQRKYRANMPLEQREKRLASSRRENMTVEKREAIRERDRKYWSKMTPEQREAKRIRARERRKELPIEVRRARSRRILANKTPEQREARREYMRMRTLKGYNLTPGEFIEIFNLQNKRCACCNSMEPRAKNGWHIDHDHDTEVIRGIICHICNTILGWFGDNLEDVRTWKWELGITYLENTAPMTAQRLEEIRKIK